MQCRELGHVHNILSRRRIAALPVVPAIGWTSLLLLVVSTIARALLLESANVAALLLLLSAPAVAPVVPVAAARARVVAPRSAVASAIVGTHRRTVAVAVLDGSFLIIGDTSCRSETKILAGDDNLVIVINIRFCAIY